MSPTALENYHTLAPSASAKANSKVSMPSDNCLGQKNVSTEQRNAQGGLQTAGKGVSSLEDSALLKWPLNLQSYSSSL